MRLKRPSFPGPRKGRVYTHTCMSLFLLYCCMYVCRMYVCMYVCRQRETESQREKQREREDTNFCGLSKSHTAKVPLLPSHTRLMSTAYLYQLLTPKSGNGCSSLGQAIPWLLTTACASGCPSDFGFSFHFFLYKVCGIRQKPSHLFKKPEPLGLSGLSLEDWFLTS